MGRYLNHFQADNKEKINLGWSGGASDRTFALHALTLDGP